MKAEHTVGTVTHKPHITDRRVSVSMTDAKGTRFDAVAFMRSPIAIEQLQTAEIGATYQLHGHWETNPNNGYLTFVVNHIGTNNPTRSTHHKHGNNLQGRIYGTPTSNHKQAAAKLVTDEGDELAIVAYPTEPTYEQIRLQIAGTEIKIVGTLQPDGTYHISKLNTVAAAKEVLQTLQEILQAR